MANRSQNDNLEHHGVIGMKWGVRRKNSVSKGFDKLKTREKTPQPASTTSKASLRKKKVRKRSQKEIERERTSAWEKLYANRNTMTDAQLRAKVNRLQLENQFQQQVKTSRQLVGTKQQDVRNFMRKMRDVTVIGTGATAIVLDAMPNQTERTRTASTGLKNVNKVLNQTKKKEG